FNQASTSACATILNTLHDVMGKILSLLGEYFETEYSHTSEPDICVMLGITIEHPCKYPLLFPALYPDLDVRSKKLFGNWKALANILKAALFGPKSIQVTCKSDHLLTQQKTSAQIWGMTTLTPGIVTQAITGCTLYLLFFLLPSISFLRDC
ncbi:hypothetical protein PAXRUDRAFT_153348, partial [Paxillus rubicundulus Ve08.2h10]